LVGKILGRGVGIKGWRERGGDQGELGGELGDGKEGVGQPTSTLG